jgi:flagellar assembly factor FliW
MLILSEHLGEIEVDDTTIVDIPEGLLGFPQATRFVLVAAEDTGLYSWLQSVDHPDVSFLAVVPNPFFPDYEPDLPDDDCQALELERPDDAQVLCLVTIGDEVTANLLGPVVVNVRTRLGRQVVLAHQDLTTAAPIRPVE